MTRPDLWLVRHGETDWSRAGKHTGRTDVPLNATGEAAARTLHDLLAGDSFDLVLTSPLQRARRTCELAGYGDVAQVDDDLREWDYGDYEGITTTEIRKTRPGWSAFADGVPGGETLSSLGARADRVIERVRQVEHRALVLVTDTRCVRSPLAGSTKSPRPARTSYSAPRPSASSAGSARRQRSLAGTTPDGSVPSRQELLTRGTNRRGAWPARDRPAASASAAVGFVS